ncbi:hypothetical protein Tco_0676079 [Tanacetum coccineum]
MGGSYYCFLAQFLSTKKDCKTSATDILMSPKHIKENLSQKAWIISSKDLLLKKSSSAIDFGSKSKSFMTMSLPPQDEPLTNRPMMSQVNLHRRLIEIENQMSNLDGSSFASDAITSSEQNHFLMPDGWTNKTTNGGGSILGWNNKTKGPIGCMITPFASSSTCQPATTLSHTSRLIHSLGLKQTTLLMAIMDTCLPAMHTAPTLHRMALLDHSCFVPLLLSSLVIFDEKQLVFSTWIAFGGNTLELGSFGEETDEITDVHQIHEEILFSKRGDGVAGIKRRRCDPSSDSVIDLVTASGRGRLNKDLESSM